MSTASLFFGLEAFDGTGDEVAQVGYSLLTHQIVLPFASFALFGITDEEERKSMAAEDLLGKVPEYIGGDCFLMCWRLKNQLYSSKKITAYIFECASQQEPHAVVGVPFISSTIYDRGVVLFDPGLHIPFPIICRLPEPNDKLPFSLQQVYPLQKVVTKAKAFYAQFVQHEIWIYCQNKDKGWTSPSKYPLIQMTSAKLKESIITFSKEDYSKLTMRKFDNFGQEKACLSMAAMKQKQPQYTISMGSAEQKQPQKRPTKSFTNYTQFKKFLTDSKAEVIKNFFEGYLYDDEWESFVHMLENAHSIWCLQFDR